MCGICFVCCLKDEDDQCQNSKDISHPHFTTKSDIFQNSLLPHRGPDASSYSEISICGKLKALMQGCVLHLRGDLTPQPITNSKGNSLLWNGEIFSGIEVKDNENDTQVLFDLLDSCSTEESILHVFQKIDGPWAVIYWQEDAKTLWFGRDMFGRRSLLWHLPEGVEENFVLSSVALDEKVYKEIPSVGIFSMNFSDLKNQADGLSSADFSLPPIVIHPWLECRWPGTNLHVNKTQTEDLTEYLYPSSQQSGARFCLSEYQIDRWIPTQCTSLSESNDVQDTDSGSQSECLIHGKEQHRFSDAGSTSEIERRKNDPADLTQGYEEVLQEVWEKNEDLHILVKKCLETLQEAVATRVRKLEQGKGLPEKSPHASSARIAVLFSGGLDSTILAALADRCLPENEPIDLLNVAFEQPAPSVPQQRSGKQKKPRKQNKKNSHQGNRGEESNKIDPEVGCSLLTDQLAGAVSLSGDERREEYSKDEEFHSAHTGDASSSRATISKLYDTKSQCYQSNDSENSVNTNREPRSRSSDLGSNNSCSLSHDKSQNSACPNFSGQDWSTTDSYTIPNISSGLSSVSESQNLKSIHPHSNEASKEIERDSVSASAASFDPFNVPDRQTARTAFSELNPRRKWNFVEINITQAELQAVRQSHISRVIYPLRTVLDDSIGCAVWFAARGKGVLNSGTAKKEHQAGHIFHSRAQVLLCGMAADELFAGYSRHRVTFNKEGWSGLEKEIQEELWRISVRNLGRDDRIIADHGKEARFPYLDEKFVQLVSEIPLQKRVDLSYPRGIGEKLLLRLCALNLGLAKTACQAKRAIQFGSKIAKLDNRKEKGSDVCERLL